VRYIGHVTSDVSTATGQGEKHIVLYSFTTWQYRLNIDFYIFIHYVTAQIEYRAAQQKCFYSFTR